MDGALRQVLGSLEALRAQDETYWTAVAALSASYLETTAGHLDDAIRHAEEARDPAERFGYNWLAAWSRVLLGTLNVMRGRLGQARELLDEALDLSLAIYVTRNVSLCLIAYAQLALAAGDPGRAALLAGAAEGLRRRAGLGAWPMLRQPEAALLDQVRHALSLGEKRITRRPALRWSFPDVIVSGAQQVEAGWPPSEVGWPAR